MDEKTIDKVTILAKLCAICDLQVKLQEDKNKLEAELEQLEKDERKKIITIKPKGISQKQWANLLLELNLMKTAWKPYGVDLQMSAPGLKNVLKWGTRSYDRTKGSR